MNLFSKKLIIKYMDFLENKDAEDMVQKIPNNFPKYFYSIPKTMFNPVKKKFIPYARTIKTCSGFINLYKRSLLLTSPFDMYVEFNNNEIIDQKIGQNIPDYFINLCLHIHPGQQFLDYVPNNKKYKFILKITLPFLIDGNVSIKISKSDYHFNNFDVLPGIISNKYKEKMHIFIPIEKERNEFYIKKGDPLCLMTPLCETKIKLKFKKLKENEKSYLTFSSLKNFSLKNLI